MSVYVGSAEIIFPLLYNDNLHPTFHYCKLRLCLEIHPLLVKYEQY